MTKFVPEVLVMVSVSSDLVAWVILASCGILYIFSQSHCFDTVLSLSIFEVKTGIIDCGLRFKSICILEVLLSSKASRYAECTFAFSFAESFHSLRFPFGIHLFPAEY